MHRKSIATCCVLLIAVTAQAAGPSPQARFIDSVLTRCDEVESRIDAMVPLAEQVADRYIGGGQLVVIWAPPSATGPQGPQYEIKGRSGGLAAFDGRPKRPDFKPDRTRDVAIIGWQREPDPRDLAIIEKYRKGYFVIGFGPRGLPSLAEHVDRCDAWIDTATGADDRAITLSGGTRAGRLNVIVNALNSWAFLAEVVSAMTRRGKMPVILRSHAWPDSDAWNDKYRLKKRFCDDIEVAPIACGELARRYLGRMRELIRRFTRTQSEEVTEAAKRIAAELAAGRKTVVAQTGHTSYQHVGHYEDAAWAEPVVLYNTKGRKKQYPGLAPEGALVLRLGYQGFDPELLKLVREQQQRLMLIAVQDAVRPGFEVPADARVWIDMGWRFGDATIEIDGFPTRLFPASGVMQMVAYEAVNVEVLSRRFGVTPTH